MNLLLTQIVKEALHAHQRGAERLSLPPESIDQIQKATDKIWYGHARNKLHGSWYYSPLRDPDKNLLGYATFKRVGTTPYASRLVLTTILTKQMKPRGDNIGHFFGNHQVKGQYPTGLTLEKYKGMMEIPDAKHNPYPKAPE
jgi:hypothetical protein